MPCIIRTYSIEEDTLRRVSEIENLINSGVEIPALRAPRTETDSSHLTKEDYIHLYSMLPQQPKNPVLTMNEFFRVLSNQCIDGRNPGLLEKVDKALQARRKVNQRLSLTDEKKKRVSSSRVVTFLLQLGADAVLSGINTAQKGKKKIEPKGRS